MWLHWVIVSGLCAACFIGLVRPTQWPSEMFLSLFPQLTIAAAIIGANLMRQRALTPAAIALLCGGVALVHMQEQFAQKNAPPSEPALRIIWANVLGRDAAMREIIERASRDYDADIVLIAETPLDDHDKYRALARDHFTEFAGAIAGGESVISVLSTAPILSFEQPAGFVRKGAVLSIETPTGPIIIGGVHPVTPGTPNRTIARDAHVLAVAQSMGAGHRRVLVGDFNTVPWSPSFRALEKSSGLQRLGVGGASTWGAPLPFFGLPIDHAMIDQSLIGSARVGPLIGSDHFPLIIDIADAPQNLAAKAN